MTALEKIEIPRPSLIRPIVKANEMIEAHKEVSILIRDALEEGKDYGKIPETTKNTLLKPGAERLVKAFGCSSRFTLIDKDLSYDKQNKWTDKWGKEKTSEGYYRYVYKCEILTASGGVVGDSDGSCSTMESKYISRPHNCENTVIKMAQKRALVGAVLNAFGLSDRFTQDEDTIEIKTEEKPHDPVYRATDEDKRALAAFCVGVGTAEPTGMRRFSDYCIGRTKDFRERWEEYSKANQASSHITNSSDWKGEANVS